MHCPSFIYWMKIHVAITVSFLFCCYIFQCPLIKDLETMFGLNTEQVTFVLVLRWISQHDDIIPPLSISSS